MKCEIRREQLLEPVLQAERATAKNPSLPVLSCVLIEVAEGVLSVTATNLEVGVRYTVPILSGEAGLVAVSGSILAHVLTPLPAGAMVNMWSDEGHLVVESVSGRSRIALQDANDFPNIPYITEGEEVTLGAQDLREVLQSVMYCASAATMKPELASVFVHPDGAMLVAAATDSFRLAEKRVPQKSAVSCEPLLIPARSATDLVRTLEKVKDQVTLRRSEHQLSLELPGIYLTMRLTAGTFPDYTQIIPKEFSTEVTVLRFDLERALRKAAVFSGKFNKTVFTVSPKEETFTIYTESSALGDTTDRVAAKLSGEPLTASFNHRYLMEALVPITTDSVILQFVTSSHPVLVRPVGDESFRYIVMPMNR